MKAVDYYFSPMSPWTYLGHSRFADIAKRHGAVINVKPVDYGKIFPVSGGVPVAKRAPQRQAYRFAELKRWQKFLDVPLTLEPKFFPYDSSLAARLIIAADGKGSGSAMRLASAILKACWAQDRNMADEEELSKVCEEQGLKSRELIDAAKTDETRKRFDELTEEAIGLQVFGAPTYAYKGELFWGQDRLDFVERALATSP